MSFSGSLVQNAIYIAQHPPEWPVAAEDWERAAEAQLEPGPFGYIAGGAGSESTMRANLDAFAQWRLRPRMLTGNAVRDISVEVLGLRSPAPFFLAPIGVLSIAHEEGEVACARAAATSGIPFILSSAASHSIEEVAEAMGDAPRWFQLYWVSDREVVESLVGRAAIADLYKAFFKDFRCALKTEIQEVEVAGDWAFVRGLLTSTVTPKDGGEPHTNHGKYLVVARRGTDGVWRFARDSYNMDQPPGQH